MPAVKEDVPVRSESHYLLDDKDDLSTLPLRERKKIRTRRHLVETAESLFIKFGYDEVTLERIADESEITIKTVLAYYPTKRHLAVARYAASLSALVWLVENRKPGDTVFDVCRYAFTAQAKRLLNQRDKAKYFAFIEANPDLANQAYAGTIDAEEAFMNALLQDEKRKSFRDPIRVRLIGAMLIHYDRIITANWLHTGKPANLIKALTDAVDEVESYYNKGR